MSSPSVKLYRLRGVFFAYFLFESIIGAAVAWSVLRLLIGGHFGWQGWSAGSLALFSLTVIAMVLALAWLVFGRLLEYRNWARVLLLVLGWLTVTSAVFGLLASTQISHLDPWITRWLPNMDWEKLMQYDRIQKVFELVFWGYLISVLQFDAEVRSGFLPGMQDEAAPTQGR